MDHRFKFWRQKRTKTHSHQLHQSLQLLQMAGLLQIIGDFSSFTVTDCDNCWSQQICSQSEQAISYLKENKLRYDKTRQNKIETKPHGRLNCERKSTPHRYCLSDINTSRQALAKKNLIYFRTHYQRQTQDNCREF